MRLENGDFEKAFSVVTRLLIKKASFERKNPSKGEKQSALCFFN